MEVPASSKRLVILATPPTGPVPDSGDGSLARRERQELGLERRLPGRPMTAAADGDSTLLEAVEAEPLVDVGRVDAGREEGAETEVGGDEVEGLAQVARVHEQDRVCPLV